MQNQSAIVDALYTGRKNSAAPVGIDEIQISIDEALELQLSVSDRFHAAGEKIGGWKVGLTSGQARDRMGKDFRPFGYVLQSRILQSGAQAPYSTIFNCSVEPELCLIVGKPLRGASVTVEEAKAAVRAVAPAFEINERRVGPDKGNMWLLADGLAQWGIVVGSETPVRDGLIDTTVEFYENDKLRETKTPGTTMDDPYLSLARACRLLHKYGRGFEPGQPVITGSFCHHTVRGPGTYRAVFSGIGTVAVQFV